MAEAQLMSDPVLDAKEKSKDFLEKAKAGTLDESSLKWGLSAGAVVAGVSLLFRYIDLGGYGGITGLDLLRFRGNTLNSLEAISIPGSALFGLYLHFIEPNAKLLKMETPGRPKTIYLIGLIAGALGVLGCLDFLRVQVCLGSVLGFAGLGLLTFVYFKLWQAAPEAPANTTPPPSEPPAAKP
jgi:hypothetical protein